MKRISKLLITLMGVLPALAGAFGLGQLKLESGLNQPFEARIDMVSATADELSSLNIRLADSEAFQRAGIDRLYLLTSLKFEIHETESGPDFIRVFSTDPVREPYLNFLVEASWSNGRLLREFTVLLDPPLYDPNARRAVVSAPAATEPVTETAESEPAQAATGESAGVGTTAGGYTQGDYGPTSAADTLWSIASTTRADATISVQQMMIAIQRANPDAFAANNINGLKRGQILRIPGRDEVLALTQTDAMAEARAQNALWQESQGGLPTTPTRPLSGSRASEAGDAATTEVAKESSELRLVAAAESGSEGARGSSTGVAASGASGADLALANEQIETLSQENADLKSRLTEAESIIEDQKRLLSLKDDELAKLQQQAASGAAVPTEEAAAPAAETTASTTETGAAGTEQPVTPAAEQTTPAETTPAPAATPPESAPAPAPPAPVEEPQGMVDQILGMVRDNIIIVAGGAGGLVLIIVGFIVISRRRARAGEAEAAPFAYAGVAEEPTLAPGGLIESEAATVLPEAEVEAEAEARPAAVEPKAAAAPAPAPEAAAAPEEDPLAEVNVFLAYEHFDQAEEFVRDAIAGHPNNLDFHTKLLEVFYAAGDKVKYEAAAKVLHDQVGGAGSHWDMAVAMWSEMSPSRALFEAGGAEEAAPAASAAGASAAGGGVFDLTAGESKPAKPAAADMSLDFDLGDTTDVPAVKKAGKSEDVLDLTAAASITSMTNEDLLDVTAAVGLEPEPVQAAPPAEDELMLDITSGQEAPAENPLDISLQSSDNLLDVTAQADTGTLSGEEDLLDVTAATSAGADADELLEIEKAAPAQEKDENMLDFDISGIETPAPAGAAEDSLELDIGGAAAQDDGNVIEFDGGSTAKQSASEAGLDLSLPESDKADTGGLEVDLGIGGAGDGEPAVELDSASEEGGIEFDLTGGEEAGGLDLGLELESEAASAPDLDLDATLKIPEIDMAVGEGDEAEDHTVFVPRSADAKEQTTEDEIATKLDLAKAYVELGDQDSAKGILEEIIQDGNAQQKATARDLLKQVK